MNPVAHVLPLQHGCPMPPQVPQVPFMQVSPAVLQVVPQHGWPEPPQVVQVPTAHTNVDVVQLLPQHF
jgi:hypothetical protein